MNDRQAIERLQKGDLQGLSRLVQQYQTHAIRVAYAIVRERTQAEDVVQAAFVRLPEYIRQFDAERAFAPWFMRVVAHDAIAMLRRDARFVTLDDGLPESGWFASLSSTSPLPEEMLLNLETSEQLWALLERLSPEQRAVIVLRYYSDLSGDEIGEHLRIPVGTVRWRLHAALKRLRGLLKRTDGFESRHASQHKQETLR